MGNNPKKVSLIGSGWPTVRETSGALTNIPVELDAVASRESFELNIDKISTKYRIDFDVATHALRNSQYTFSVFIDTPETRSVDFRGDQNSISVFKPSAGRLPTIAR